MTTPTLRITTLFLLALCVALYIYTDRQRDYYNASAKPAAAAMLSELSSWQQETLLKHLSPAALDTLDQRQIDALLNHYRQFGQLQKIDDLEFSRLSSALSLLGETRINYTSAATFSNGRARINITLTAAPNGYKIYNLSINPADKL